MRVFPRARLISAALVLVLLTSTPLAAAQDDEELFPNACREVDPMTAVAHGYANPLTVILNGEPSEPAFLETDTAEATQVGPGKSGDRTAFLDVSVPDEEEPIVTAQLLAGRVDLDVDGPEDGLEAEAWSNAKLAHVNILQGTVTADVVRGFAYARTDVRSARTHTDASTIVNLNVAGVLITDISPGANITLPDNLFGVGSYVSVYERIDTSMPPTPDSPFYVADVWVRMLHVHITRMPLLGMVDVIVSEVHSRAVSPTPFCGVAQTVEAGGYTARIREGVEHPGILIGEQHIGITGGSAHQQLLGQYVDLLIGGDVHVNVTEVDAEGKINAGVSSDSRAMSQILHLCIRLDASEPECFVEVTLVKATVECHADEDGAHCDGDVQILRLIVDGVDVCASLGIDGTCDPEPAKADPTYRVGPIGIWLNQQERVESDGYASLYVRAIRIETPIPAVGTIIIGRAYASAGFEEAGTLEETDEWDL